LFLGRGICLPSLARSIVWRAGHACGFWSICALKRSAVVLPLPLICGRAQRWGGSDVEIKPFAWRTLMPLMGAELLQAVDQLKALPKAEIVRRCGYVSASGNGDGRLNYTAFFEALLEAKGLPLGHGRSSGQTARGKRISRSGRSLPYHTKVQFNGNLMVGKAYIDLLDAKPGDHFAIHLGRDSIRLIPLVDPEPAETSGGGD